MSKAHFVHVSVDVEEFHFVGVFSDLIEPAVLVGSDESGRSCPCGLFVNIVLARTSMAVGSERGRDKEGEKEKDDGFHK